MKLDKDKMLKENQRCESVQTVHSLQSRSRRSTDGKNPYCNACDPYQILHGRPRPY